MPALRGLKNKEQNEEFRRQRRRRYSSGGDRETWSRKVEYFFAGLGYAVGLGNIWRFPYLCYRNGGGAFLIPYILSLFAAGIPIMFMEMSFGQFASLGPITIWKVCPIFKGIGYAVIIVMLLVNTYYNVLIAYSLFFLFASITDELPWANCGNKWNTKYCIIERCNPINETNGTVSLWGHAEHCTMDNITDEERQLLKTPTEEFFEKHLLEKTSGIHELGDVQWPLVVCLLVSWGTCFMCLFRGIKSMGKVVIFTTIFSYVILTILLVRGVTLPGSLTGIIYYLKPDFSRLGDLQVWGEASAQAFASLSLGGGGWITLASYNKFKNRCDRDAFLVGIGNALTSIYSGFVIFSVLGYMAYIKGVSMDHVTAKGPGLAFVAYPEGLALIPGAPLWSVCFFVMMFTVGLDSLFGQVETIVGSIIDEFPDFLRPRRRMFTLFLCSVMMLMGIPLVTQGGIFIVTLLDWYALLFSFSIISLCEVIAIMYLYGYKRFSDDIKMMVGKEPSMYFTACWLVISPLTLLCVVAFLAAQQHLNPPVYGNYEFPVFAQQIGLAIALGPTAVIPLTAVAIFFWKVPCKTIPKMFTDSESRKNVAEELLCPVAEWGPALPDLFRRYSLAHGIGLPTNEDGEDEVFGDHQERNAELKPSTRSVKFSDDKVTIENSNTADHHEV